MIHIDYGSESENYSDVQFQALKKAAKAIEEYGGLTVRNNVPEKVLGNLNRGYGLSKQERIDSWAFRKIESIAKVRAYDDLINRDGGVKEYGRTLMKREWDAMSFYDKDRKISEIERWHKEGSIRIHFSRWYGAYIIGGAFVALQLIADIIQH